MSIRFARQHAVLLPLLLLSYGLRAQAIKEVTRTSADNPSYTERYSVLKSSSKTKHGPYTKSGMRGVLEEGFYKNGQKDSLWRIHAPFRSEHVLAAGAYRNNEKVGPWRYFTDKDELDQEYDHTQRQLLYLRPASTSKLKYQARLLVGEADTSVQALTTPPLFLGGSALLFSYIGPNIRYPSQALRAGVGGRVLVAFTVKPDGTTENYRVKEGIGSGCDEEALRVVQAVPATWLPGQAQGKPVACEVIIPLTFTNLGTTTRPLPGR
jgi:TonB family protein